MNHKNFHFTQIPDKTNDVIFFKSPKTMFLDHFCPMGIFSKNIRLSHTTIYGPLLDKQKGGQKRDRQTLFYRTFPAKARGPATSLQQVTDGNTPNLVLKKMLG